MITGQNCCLSLIFISQFIFWSKQHINKYMKITYTHIHVCFSLRLKENDLLMYWFSNAQWEPQGQELPGTVLRAPALSRGRCKSQRPQRRPSWHLRERLLEEDWTSSLGISYGTNRKKNNVKGKKDYRRIITHKKGVMEELHEWNVQSGK